jgi:hypothetical protein
MPPDAHYGGTKASHAGFQAQTCTFRYGGTIQYNHTNTKTCPETPRRPTSDCAEPLHMDINTCFCIDICLHGWAEKVRCFHHGCSIPRSHDTQSRCLGSECHDWEEEQEANAHAQHSFAYTTSPDDELGVGVQYDCYAAKRPIRPIRLRSPGSRHFFCGRH